MEFQRRAAQGTLSEVFGEDALEFDQLFRTLGINESASTTFVNFQIEEPLTSFLDVKYFFDCLQLTGSQ